MFKKRTTVRIITFLSAALVVTGVLALNGYNRARNLELYARSSTQRAFDELVTSVSELSNTLEKSVYVTDPTLESALCTQMFGRAVTAQSVMGELPWSSVELENVSSFLAKVGDYACTLSRTVGDNGGYSDEELENLQSLADTAGVMSLNLQDMQARMLSGNLTMDEVYGAAKQLGSDGEQAPLAGTAFQSIEEEFPELPTLIYDGPFSESMTSSDPKYLEGRDEVSADMARRTAAKFLGLDESSLTELGEMGGDIPCRCYTGRTDSGEYTVYVTKQGGYVMSAICSRIPGSVRVRTEDALKTAEIFANQQGLPGLKKSYHIIENGVLTVNFQYAEDGVICYPDLVKVSVALDTGAVMDYDAKGYLSCHFDRELPEPEITVQQAREELSPALTIRAQNLALIPSPGGEERLCYEFVCHSQEDRRYVIYVNALTGAQEKILILLEDDSGTLTI